MILLVGGAILVGQPGLHLGKNLRGVKIRFYESKGGGGNAINICMCKAVSTQHLRSRSMPPEEFLNFRHIEIASGTFSGRGRSRI